MFFLLVFQVAEVKTTGLLQAPCSLGMNTFVTGPLQHVVLVLQKKIVKDYIQNAYKSSIYQIPNECLIFLFDWKYHLNQSLSFKSITTATKSFRNISNVSGIIDPLLHN